MAATDELSLLQYTQLLRNTIAAEPGLRFRWVRAELSDFSYRGGHCYMDLIEKDETGATQARLRATIWASQFPALSRKFQAGAGQPLATGLKVLVCVTANHHPQYGLSVNISDIDPSYTLGDIERIRREILLRLGKEGILNRNRELPLTMTPQRVAIISSETAAGYGDFMKELNKEGALPYQWYTHLFPAYVQGERTSPSVRAALDMVEATIDLWDCVVIIRGGGSTSDLCGFDDYELARAVALFPLPVLVGIGHERDRTVLDEIAHTRLKTPTAVAGFLRSRLDEAWSHAYNLAQDLRLRINELLEGEKMHLAQLQNEIPARISALLQAENTRLANVGASLGILAENRVSLEQRNLLAIAQTLRVIASQATEAPEMRLRQLSENLANAIRNRIDSEERRLAQTESLVSVLDPINTLRRGYSITTLDGHALRDPSQAPQGATITTRLAEGTLTSTVNHQ